MNAATSFRTLSESVGQFDLKKKIFLIPEMNRIGCHLLAATFRAFGIRAAVMETYQGLELGKEFTSGKECFPCQVTTGDILLFMRREKQRLGSTFDPEEYVYFMPEATGPCRFGMYNKYQRIVLDSFPELRRLKIGTLTTGNSYSLSGMIDEKRSTELRIACYFSVLIGDALDRLLWRVRPYEKKSGMADDLIQRAVVSMSQAFEEHGEDRDFNSILKRLETILGEIHEIVDPAIPRKPLIGIVGEIYLRTHVHANQELARMIEKYGGEVVISPLSEWVDFTAYENARLEKIGFRLCSKQMKFGKAVSHLRETLNYTLKLFFQRRMQKKINHRIRSYIDLLPAHDVAHLEEMLLRDDTFSFDVGTEACLSIAGLMSYMEEGYNGVVNVYPFTCMPGTITSSIMRPLAGKRGVPFLDAPYDGTNLPGREAAIRTFMYQAKQHLQRNGSRGSAAHKEQ